MSIYLFYYYLVPAHSPNNVYNHVFQSEIVLTCQRSGRLSGIHVRCIVIDATIVVIIFPIELHDHNPNEMREGQLSYYFLICSVVLC